MTWHKKRILLLDDDYESMSPLKIFLEAVYGYEVELTAQQTILERLRYERFDLLCIDYMIMPVSLDGNKGEVHNIHFPGVNWQRTGQAFLERLRLGQFTNPTEMGTPASVPVIVFSAVADTRAYETRAIDSQIIRYFEKPFDLEELVDYIDQLLKDR